MNFYPSFAHLNFRFSVVLDRANYMQLFWGILIVSWMLMVLGQAVRLRVTNCFLCRWDSWNPLTMVFSSERWSIKVWNGVCPSYMSTCKSRQVGPGGQEGQPYPCSTSSPSWLWTLCIWEWSWDSDPLLPYPVCLEYKYMPPHLVCVRLGVWPRATHAKWALCSSALSLGLRMAS